MKKHRSTHASRTIGLAIRNERESRGMRQFDLAWRAGLSERQLSRMECGEALASASLDAVLKALGVRLVVRLDRNGGEA